MNNIDIIQIAKNAKNAFLKTMNLDNATKNKALENIIEALKKYGPCPIHRKTFYPVSKYYSQNEQLAFALFDEE